MFYDYYILTGPRVSVGNKKCTVSSVEKRRIDRVLASWPEDTRHCYAVTCWAALEHVGLAIRPGEYFWMMCLALL